MCSDTNSADTAESHRFGRRRVNTTRIGKIARLPKDLREQLNRRLQDGEPGKRLLDWLNALPRIQEILAAQFGGRSITKQNLSEWRRGGYLDWEAAEEHRMRMDRLTERAVQSSLQHQPSGTEPTVRPSETQSSPVKLD